MMKNVYGYDEVNVAVAVVANIFWKIHLFFHLCNYEIKNGVL